MACLRNVSPDSYGHPALNAASQAVNSAGLIEPLAFTSARSQNGALTGLLKHPSHAPPRSDQPAARTHRDTSPPAASGQPREPPGAHNPVDRPVPRVSAPFQRIPEPERCKSGLHWMTVPDRPGRARRGPNQHHCAAARAWISHTPAVGQKVDPDEQSLRVRAHRNRLRHHRLNCHRGDQ